MTTVVIMIIATIIIAVIVLIRSNPDLKDRHSDVQVESDDPSISIRLQEINLMVEYLMRTKKVYLDPNLRCTKLAEMVGTNRTYLVQALHLFHGVGYSNFVNHLRFDELKVVLHSGKKYSNEELVQLTGFPTEETMIRLVKTYSGMHLDDLRTAIQSTILNAYKEPEVAEELPKPIKKSGKKKRKS